MGIETALIIAATTGLAVSPAVGVAAAVGGTALALQNKKMKEAQKRGEKRSEAASRQRLLDTEQKAETARRTNVRSAVLSGGVTGILNPAGTSTRSRLLGN